MSRVCVKYLPKHISQERFLEVFSAVGDVTDVKLLKTPTGEKRNMGFVGYRNEADATRAIKLLHQTYVDTSRISVEEAKPIGSQDLTRPWSRYSKGSSAYTNLHPQQKKQIEKKAEVEGSKKKKIDKNDPRLLEFLGVHAKGKKWENDDRMAEAEVDKEEEEEEQPQKKRKLNDTADPTKATETKDTKKSKKAKKTKTKKEKSDTTTNQTDTGTANGKKGKAIEETPKAEVQAVTEADIEGDMVLREEFGDSDEEYEDLPEPSKQPLYLGEEDDIGSPVAEDATMAETEVDDDAEDDLEYIKSKMSDAPNTEKEDSDEAESSSADGEEEDDEEASSSGEEGEGSDGDAEEEAEGKKKTGTDESETGRLFVRNLPFTVTEEEVRDLFSPFGTITEIHIPQDKASQRSKGIAFVLYMISTDAAKARAARDKQIFQGRVLHILAGEDQRHYEKPETQEHPATNKKNTSSYKKEQEEKQKSTSGSAHNWNSLYVRSDAVADAFCARHNMKKEELFDPSNSDMAVNLALMEAQVIEETKRYFEEHDINTDVLSTTNTKTAKRSNSIIIVKNLPFESTSEELIAQFATHGPVARVVVPPSRTVAVIEYESTNDAKVGFRSLAYRKYHGVPLFLEWAPEGVFRGYAEVAKPKPIASVAAAPISTRPPSATIFITNINFATTDDELTELFSPLEGYRNMRIPKKVDPKTKQQTLSSGVAFANFNNPHNAARAIEKLQSHQLRGFKLLLDFSQARKDAAATSSSLPKKETFVDAQEEGPTKILVRNIPFEATLKDLRGLFRAVGGFKTARMPTKMDKKHRGFGFIEFLTHNEAKRALQSMSNTHLYGRHLSLEWAEQTRNLDEIRAKTAKDFSKSLG